MDKEDGRVITEHATKHRLESRGCDCTKLSLAESLGGYTAQPRLVGRLPNKPPWYFTRAPPGRDDQLESGVPCNLSSAIVFSKPPILPSPRSPFTHAIVKPGPSAHLLLINRLHPSSAGLFLIRPARARCAAAETFATQEPQEQPLGYPSILPTSRRFAPHRGFQILKHSWLSAPNTSDFASFAFQS